MTNSATVDLPMSPAEIANVAERIYEEQFQEGLEKEHAHGFVAIDIVSKTAHFGQEPEDALEKAQESAPDGVFHLIKIGAPAAFRIGFIGERYANLDRPLRPAR